MFALLRSRTVVRNPISCPIIGITLALFESKYSSISRVSEKRIRDAPSSARAEDAVTSIIKLLKSYEFTDPQITKFCSKLPIKPSYDPTTLVKPKLDFFLVIGFSRTQLAKFISSNLLLLNCSLEKRIKPNALLLKEFYGTEKLLIRALLLSSSLLRCKLESSFFSNVRTMINHGVPRNNIIRFASECPRTLQFSGRKFKKMVELVVSKGFNPCLTLFCSAVHTVSRISSATWKKKVSLYRSLGWSEEDTVSAFFKHPWCMAKSERKIKLVMDFFIHERQCEPSYLAVNPAIIGYSLEKRIKPRCLVFDILVKKQLVSKRNKFNYLMISNKDFLEKYVVPYQDLAPEVLHAYSGFFPISVCQDYLLMTSIHGFMIRLRYLGKLIQIKSYIRCALSGIIRGELLAFCLLTSIFSKTDRLSVE